MSFSKEIINNDVESICDEHNVIFAMNKLDKFQNQFDEDIWKLLKFLCIQDECIDLF